MLKNGYLLLLGSIIGCSINPFSDGYKELGNFDTKIEAQNQAVAHILVRYNSLPNSENYKVLYNFRDAKPNAHSRNAIWYNKSTNGLAIEQDINRGTACRWENVDKTLLEQAIKSSSSMTRIDSLSRPNQSTSFCLK